MKRVLILSNSSSGLYDFRAGLIARLLKEGAEVVCAVPDDTSVKALRTLGARVVHTPINRRGTNPVQDMRLLGGYRKLLKKERPDAVLTYTIKPNLYGGLACSKERVPYLSTVTGLGSVYQSVANGEPLSRLAQFLTPVYKEALRDCACLFFQNETNQSVFENLGIAQGKTRLVAGSGVDLTRQKKEPYPAHTDDVTRFLYVGRLMREKGSAELIAAAKRLRKEYGDKVVFHAVGYAEENEDFADARNVMTLLPYDTQIHPHYTWADAVVMPSYHEGMSNVLMEASATARPVLASDIAGCREIVTDNETGFLFPAREEDALYEAMKRFVELPVAARERMGLAARKKMEQSFDRERIIDAYMEEIEAIW